MRRILLAMTGVIFCSLTALGQKTVFTPIEWSNTGHEYYQRMSPDRMHESENFVLYWGDLAGTNPQNASDAGIRFNPVAVADTFEVIYDRFINDLNFINDDPNTNFGRYKTPVIILGTFSGGDARTTGFAHASSYSNTIGAMFVHPAAVRDGGTISHEYAHALQMMMRIQENPGRGNAFAGYDWAGPFFEGHANYMRAMVYQKFANIDGTLTRWIQTRHFMWSSNRHHYTNYNVLFHVQETDGFDFTRRMWAESQNQEHPFETIRRLKGFSQEQLNDYLYEYAAKDVTFDYPIQWNDQVNNNSNFGKNIRATYEDIKRRMPRYTSRQYTILTQVDGSSDRFYVNEDWAPQDYGINIIPLYPTCDGDQKTVTVKFKGHTEINPNQAGWRYGFVTTKADGTVSRYSEMYSDAEGEASFALNTNTEANIYLVVFSAPKEHVNYNMDVGYPKQRRYPYELKIANAKPEGYQPANQFRSWLKNNGRIHSNGGGWVSNGANVASSVYVGPYAMVLGGSVSGNVRIEDHATVQGGNISGDVIVRDNAWIYNVTANGNSIIEGNAWMEGGSVTNGANIKGNAMLFAGNFSNAVVVGGDAEIGSCSTPGVYLQFPYWRNGRSNCDGKGAGDPSNQDINPPMTLFTNGQMNFSSTPNCSGGTTDCAGVENGQAYLDDCGKCIGGTTGQQSDDADNDGTLDCDDECPNDPNKTEAGICGCGVADNTCVSDETFTFNVSMDPMSDYTATQVQLDGNAIASAFNMTQQELINAFGNTVTYAGVEPNGTINPNSTAIAPGHWYGQNGNTVGYGDNAYLYAELNMNTLVTNIGQFPDRSTGGEQYTVRQALIYTVGQSSVQVTLVYNVAINSNEPDADNDGTPDSQDACPNDPNKAASSGACGCGNTDVDVDNDGICDTEDDDLDNDNVVTGEDCDDNDPQVGAATVWYADYDQDGLGDASDSQTACVQPDNFVAVTGDECPNNQTKTLPGDCGCDATEESCRDCLGVVDGTATVDDCGICSGGSSGLNPCAQTLQVEEACVVDGTIDDNNTGYNGSGFANTTNVLDAEIVLSIEASNAGATTLGFVYANGGTVDRPGTILVNGSNAGSLTLSPSGGWSTWETEYITVALEAGVNIITITATTENGLANLDQITFESTGFAIGSCEEDCHGDLGGTAALDVCNVCAGGNTGRVPVTDSQDCIATSVNETLDLSRLVYPNPTTDQLFFTNQVDWELYDLAGLKLAEGLSSSLSMGAYPPGMYFLKIEGQLIKFIKE